MGHWTQAAWDALAPQFATTHRVVAFDLPGFGASDKPDATYTLAYFTDALERIVAGLGLETFALAGHSYGGLIAANYAARNASRVRALALLNAPGFARTPKIVVRIAASRPAAFALRGFAPPRRFVETTLDRSVFDPACLSAETRERAFRLACDPGVARAYARIYAGAYREMRGIRAFHRTLAAWRGPALLVWGRQDRYVPFAGLARARTVYPEAGVLAIDRCGHCPAIEYPALVARALAATGF